jgi:hypothetical protein
MVEREPRRMRLLEGPPSQVGRHRGEATPAGGASRSSSMHASTDRETEAAP